MINAFRHQRFLHTSESRTISISSSDQRLSASKIFAPEYPAAGQCQPGGDQRLSASKIFAQAVHRPASAANGGDQRLSASKIFAHHAPATSFNGREKRDQRLSASKIFALERKHCRVVVQEVINAFRHQRFLHL